MKKISQLITGSGLFFAMLSGSFAQEYSLAVLPHLDSTPGYYTRATGVNETGDVTGYEFQNSHSVKAFLIKNGQIQDLSSQVPYPNSDAYGFRVTNRDAQGFVQILGKSYDLDGIIKENDYFMPIFYCVSYLRGIVHLPSVTLLAGTVDNTALGSRPTVWDEHGNLLSFLGPVGQQGTVFAANKSIRGDLLLVAGGTRTMPNGGSFLGQPFIATFNPNTHLSTFRLLPKPEGAVDAYVTSILANGAAFAIAKMPSGDERPYFYSRQGMPIALPTFPEHPNYNIVGSAIVGNDLIAIGQGYGATGLYYLDRAVRWKVSSTGQTEIRKIHDLLPPAVASQWETYYFFMQDINSNGDIVGYGRPLPINGWWEDPVILHPANGSGGE